jgi:uncharacterized protein (DUF433 family)
LEIDMAEVLEFTASEVAFVLQEPVKVVKKALDEGPVEPKLIKKPGGRVRAVEWADLVYLLAVRSLREKLTPKARNEFYHALKRSVVDRTKEVRFGQLSVSIDDFKAEVEERTKDLAALADKVDFREDGEAILKGTDVEVYRIAALLSGGLSEEEVRADYPSLTLQQIRDASDYAKAHPKVGRPYPKTTFKRAMRGSGLEALDEVLDARG